MGCLPSTCSTDTTCAISSPDPPTPLPPRAGAGGRGVGGAAPADSSLMGRSGQALWGAERLLGGERAHPALRHAAAWIFPGAIRREVPESHCPAAV